LTALYIIPDGPFLQFLDSEIERQGGASSLALGARLYRAQ
jgi:hypothetical protein